MLHRSERGILFVIRVNVTYRETLRRVHNAHLNHRAANLLNKFCLPKLSFEQRLGISPDSLFVSLGKRQQRG